MSPRERLASVLLLLLLPAFAFSVYFAGRRIDPELLPPVLPAAAAPRSPAVSTPAIDDVVRAFAASIAAPGWVVDSPPQAFEAGRLYEKIDGRADLYLRRGARRLVSLSLANGDRFIDVFVYDMGQPGNARQLFDEERPAGARDVDAGERGYAATGSYFFIAGCDYAQIVASDAAAESDRVAGALARHLASLLGKTPCR